MCRMPQLVNLCHCRTNFPKVFCKWFIIMWIVSISPVIFKSSTCMAITATSLVPTEPPAVIRPWVVSVETFSTESPAVIRPWVTPVAMCRISKLLSVRVGTKLHFCFVSHACLPELTATLNSQGLQDKHVIEGLFLCLKYCVFGTGLHKVSL